VRRWLLPLVILALVIAVIQLELRVLDLERGRASQKRMDVKQHDINDIVADLLKRALEKR